ncbi:MAG: hypothetical protein ACOC33_00670 [bacterium]
MINFITLDRQDENDIDFSDDLGNINLDSSIVISSRKQEKNITLDKLNKITFIATDNIAFTNYTSINDYAILDLSLKCKICYPKYIDLSFTAPFGCYYYNSIYPSFDWTINDDNILLQNIRCILYIDKTIFRHLDKSLSFKKMDKLISLNIQYNINSENKINDIYYVKDDYVFNSFIDHFDK